MDDDWHFMYITLCSRGMDPASISMCGSFQLLLSSSEVTGVAVVSRGSACVQGTGATQ